MFACSCLLICWGCCLLRGACSCCVVSRWCLLAVLFVVVVMCVCLLVLRDGCWLVCCGFVCAFGLLECWLLLCLFD